MTQQPRSGFSLVELLVTISVVGILGAITVGAVGTVRENAQQANDVSAARQLAAAYLMYPQEHRGKLMPSVPSQRDQQLKLVYDNYGNPITNAGIIKRYVYHLLPYMGSLDAAYPGQSQWHLQELLEDGDAYKISLYPSFGINADYVGGNYEGGRYAVDKNPAVAITTLSQCINPSEQILFVSALSAGVSDAAPYTGYFRVDAPNAIERGGGWSGSYNPGIPKNLGNIHLRYNEQAVVAHLDGSVAMLDEEQLSDMRRWSNEARDYNDENYNPR